MKLCRKKLHLVDYSRHKQCPGCAKITKARFNRSEKGKAMKRRDHEKHREQRLATMRHYSERMNQDADWAHKENARKALWKRENKEWRSANARKRLVAIKNATPKWLTKAQIKEIESFYDLAEEIQWLSEERLVVDHIVPFQGKNVCGLHVPWNLQILPNSINCKKSNRVQEW
jgi:hypothetical protein